MKYLLNICLLLILTQCQTVSMGPPDAQVIKCVETYGKKIAYDQDLEYLGWGQNAFMDADKSLYRTIGSVWAINLIDRRMLMQNEARQVILNVYDEYQSLTFLNPEFMQAYRDYISKDRDVMFSDRNIAIKIAYWDEKNDRYLPPYVAQVRILDGNILYFFVAQPNQALGEPVVETIAEARSKI